LSGTHTSTPGLVQIDIADTTLVQQVSTTRTTPTTTKQDNYSLKEDNLVHKLDSEKLETEPTNAYNQPTNNGVKKCYHGLDRVQQAHKR
jgi:hypothetical protein